MLQRKRNKKTQRERNDDDQHLLIALSPHSFKKQIAQKGEQKKKVEETADDVTA